MMKDRKDLDGLQTNLYILGRYTFGLNKRKPVQGECLVLLWLHMLTTRGPHPNSYSTRECQPKRCHAKDSS